MSITRPEHEALDRSTRRGGAALVPVGAGGLLLVVSVGALVGLSPVVALALVVAAARPPRCGVRPVTAAILVALVTPLVAGIDRGRLFPVLRPNEALVAFLAAVLVVRAVVSAPTGHRWTLRLNGIEVTLVAMALANSIVLLTVMVLRGQEIRGDDLTYALVLWKYLALYAVVRASVRTEQDIRVCLWAAMGAATLVGVIGFLQALDLAGVRQMLLGYYAPYGYTGALAAPRGGSTLGLPAATADLLILNFVTATGLWWKDHRHGPALGCRRARLHRGDPGSGGVLQRVRARHRRRGDSRRVRPVRGVAARSAGGGRHGRRAVAGDPAPARGLRVRVGPSGQLDHPGLQPGELLPPRALRAAPIRSSGCARPRGWWRSTREPASCGSRAATCGCCGAAACPSSWRSALSCGSPSDPPPAGARPGLRHVGGGTGRLRRRGGGRRADGLRPSPHLPRLGRLALLAPRHGGGGLAARPCPRPRPRLHDRDEPVAGHTRG